jgi:hypothetical protein
VFLQNSEVPVIFGIYGIIFLKKIRRICPQHHGLGPPAPAHGSMNFIKCRSLVTRSMTQIKPIELVSQLLISVVHHQSDGWLRPGAAPARALIDASLPSTVARRSLSFLEPRWSVFDEVCSYGITAMRGTCLCQP